MKSLVLPLLLTFLANPPAEARRITDMLGRSVAVPDHIERVLGSVSPVTWMIYAVDPSLLAGFNSAPSGDDWRYLKPQLKSLPAIGSFGGTREINREALLALRPDVMIFWSLGPGPANRRQAEQLAGWGIPVVFVAMDRLDRYPATLRFLGDLLNRRERAEQLATYAEETLASVREATARIPDGEKVRVYYAEGPDGLATEPADSFHAELIPLAGGINVHGGVSRRHAGREKLSLEQVLVYDPQVILTQENAFFRTVAADRRWRTARAVREGRVWLIPDQPLSWFDRPPSFMRFLGLRWLTHRLYPERYPFAALAETRDFYRLFLGMAPDGKQLQSICSCSVSD